MILYTYQGVDSRSRRVCGHKQVAGYDEMKSYLERKGFTDCKIFPTRTKFSRVRFKFLSAGELSEFCFNISAIIKTGADPQSAIESASLMCRNGQLRHALTEIGGIVSKGATMAEAMGMYGHVFTNYMISVVNVGEVSENLPGAFHSLGLYFAAESLSREKVRAAVLYPSAAFGSLFALILAVLAFVLPALKSAADSAVNFGGWGIAERINVILAGVLIFAGLVSAALLILAKTKRGTAVLDKLKATAPIFGKITVNAAAARYLRGVAILAEGGANFESALDDSKNLSDNKFLSEKCAAAVRRVKQGVETDKALEELAPFPTLLSRALYFAFLTGDFTILSSAADSFEESSSAAATRFEQIFEPTVVAAAALILAAIIASVAIPTLKILGAL